MNDLNLAFDNILTSELREWVGVNMPRPPEAVPLASLVRPIPDAHDPDELIKTRFLCRGGTMLLVGPTGAGKSSLSMQMALCFGRGVDCLGIRPARPMSVLIIQAENDAGDLAEMRDGVLSGLQWPQDAASAALQRVNVATVDDKTGPAFAGLLGDLCAAYTPDMVFMDPAFAYLGGDASAQKEVSPFLRNQILPVVHQHNIGLVIVHHANKPANGNAKPQYMPGDYAYLGAGSAEWANVCRAVLALQATARPDVFEFRAAKRGFRLGWPDRQTVRHIAYHREPGTICWREAIGNEIPEDRRDRTQQIIDAIAAGAKTQVEICKRLSPANPRGPRSSVSEHVSRMMDEGLIREGKDGYVLTGKAVPQAAVMEEEI